MNLKGINQNVNPESIPDGFIYWAKNGVNGRKYDTALNEKGNAIEIALTSLNIQFKNGVCVLGNKIILFYKSNTNKDCIAVIDEITKTFSLKLERTDFNFNINKPITAEAKLNSKNELIVTFVDGLNTDKYVNLDTVNISDPLNFYNLFPTINNTTDIQLETLESGSVTTGAYFVTFQYISKDQSRTSFTTISNPIYITNFDITQHPFTSKGVNSNQSSNKSIKITLVNLDTSYSKIAIAVISKINGIISSRIIKEVDITSSTLFTVYNGTESLNTVTIGELVTKNIIYKSSKHIKSLNNQLFLAELKSPIIENFQSIANQTIIKWRSKLAFNNDLETGLLSNSKYKTGNKKTFVHDEVVAFYIQFELLDNGSFTEWYHIPGRQSLTGETNFSTLPTGGLLISARTPKKFEIEDTCIFDGDTSIPFERKGTMGYWENENETYPASFPDFPNQKVRHHKFPSIRYMYENVWGTQTTFGTKNYGIDQLDNLDIIVKNDAYDETKIKGYRIGYAKKNLSDIIVLGTGLTKFSANGNNGSGTDLPLINAGGNVFNDCIDEGGGGGDNIVTNKNYLRFNSFDIWQDRPNIQSCYLKNHIKYRLNKLVPDDKNTIAGGSYGLIAEGNNDLNLVAYSFNYTSIGLTTGTPPIRGTTSSNVGSSDIIRRLSDQTYVPNNIRAQVGSNIVDNRGSEETIHAKIEGSNLNVDVSGRFIP